MCKCAWLLEIANVILEVNRSIHEEKFYWTAADKRYRLAVDTNKKTIRQLSHFFFHYPTDCNCENGERVRRINDTLMKNTEFFLSENDTMLGDVVIMNVFEHLRALITNDTEMLVLHEAMASVVNFLGISDVKDDTKIS